MKLACAALLGSAALVSAARDIPATEIKAAADAPVGAEWWEEDLKCGMEFQHFCYQHEDSQDEIRKCLHEHKDDLEADCKNELEEALAFDCALRVAVMCGVPHHDFNGWKQCIEAHHIELEDHCPDRDFRDPTLVDDFKCGLEVYEGCHGLPDILIRECVDNFEHHSFECEAEIARRELFDCGIAVQSFCWRDEHDKERFRECVHKHDFQLSLICPHHHHRHD